MTETLNQTLVGSVGHTPPALFPGTASPDAELAAALVEAQAEFSAVAKDTANPFFKSTYADLPAVKAAAQPVLAKHGLAVLQEPNYTVIDGKIHDILTTTVIHKSGQARSSTMILRPVKQDPQAQGSAITYARRYAFMAVLGLVADNDDDGNAASGRAKPAARAKAKPTADDGVDEAALRAAHDELKAAAKEAGVANKQVVADFAEKFKGDNLLSTRSIANLETLSVQYREDAAKKALAA